MRPTIAQLESALRSMRDQRDILRADRDAFRADLDTLIKGLEPVSLYHEAKCKTREGPLWTCDCAASRENAYRVAPEALVVLQAHKETTATGDDPRCPTCNNDERIVLCLDRWHSGPAAKEPT